jgi:hypothetical protein
MHALDERAAFVAAGCCDFIHGDPPWSSLPSESGCPLQELGRQTHEAMKDAWLCWN